MVRRIAECVFARQTAAGNVDRPAILDVEGGGHRFHFVGIQFGQLLDKAQNALQLRRDRGLTSGGDYRLPWKTVAALTAALAYFLAPIDAIPDFVPLAGFIDDAAVLGLVFGAAEADLRHYCAWRGFDPDGYFGAAELTAER